jgi:pyruvate/2-oxoglutarate/acetoin dehydrogenase E1 component
MTYKEAITEDMTQLSKQPNTVFIGQGLINGDRVYGTLDGVPTTQCIELPCAENMHIGIAMGLALTGHRPIVVFQRMDFMLVCASAIINDLALWTKLSGDQITMDVTLRTIVGSTDKSFDVGLQHNKDLAYIFEPHMLVSKYEPHLSYSHAIRQPRLIIEYKDKYNDNCS